MKKIKDKSFRWFKKIIKNSPIVVIVMADDKNKTSIQSNTQHVNTNMGEEEVDFSFARKEPTMLLKESEEMKQKELLIQKALQKKDIQ